MKGRKPKPTNLKLIEGMRKDRINYEEPLPSIGVPKCPPSLVGEAKREWKRLSSELADLGLLTKLDRAALAAYCAAWEKFIDSNKQLKKEGMVTFIETKGGKYPTISPYLSIMTKAAEQMRRFLIEFGMTPSSRSRIRIDKRTVEDEEFENLLTRPQLVK